MDIVIAEPLGISPEALEAHLAPLKAAGHSVTAFDEKTADPDELVRRCQDADIAVITNEPFGAEVVDRCPSLRLLDVAFTGVDLVAMDRCAERGVAVCNCAGYADQAVAELVIGLTIDLLRKVDQGQGAVRHGGTSLGLVGGEIAGRTVGIVGTGRIGLRTAELFRAFGASLMGYSRHPNPRAEALGMIYGTLEEVLSQSDIVSIHLPLTDQTRKLIGAEELRWMKPAALLVNCARGPIVDNRALVEALAEGTIAGAALDVFCHEPPLSPDCRLLTAPNLLLTPHVGYLTHEAMERRAAIAFENIDAWLAGTPQNLRS